MTIEASLRALEAFCSPSAAITLARASRAASASAAIARCSCTGRRTSLLHVLKNAIMNDYQRMNKAQKKKNENNTLKLDRKIFVNNIESYDQFY